MRLTGAAAHAHSATHRTSSSIGAGYTRAVTPCDVGVSCAARLHGAARVPLHQSCHASEHGVASVAAMRAVACAAGRHAALKGRGLDDGFEVMEDDDDDAWEEEEEEVVDEGEMEDDVEDEGEDEGLGTSVVQVFTLHSIPNFLRPWETGQDVESSSSAFVVDLTNRLLLTTAGAVEYAKQVRVCRDGEEYDAQVLHAWASCDVALLTVKDRAFWSGLRALPLGGLPHLQSGVRVAGYPIGGDMLAITKGVVSRIEVVEYTHSGRGLLALQVDAAVNPGGWGGPLLDSRGACVGMAFQKYASQTWFERYDESLGSGSLFEGTDEDEQEEGDDQGGGDGGMAGDGEEGDGSDVENIAYAVPTLILQRVLSNWQESQAAAAVAAAAAARASEVAVAAETAGARSARGGRGSGGMGGSRGRVQQAGRGGRRQGAAGTAAGATAAGTGQGAGAGAGAGAGTAAAESDRTPASSSEHNPADTQLVNPWGNGRAEHLDRNIPGDLPTMGLRWQRCESEAMRRALGLQARQQGIHITAVDPTGSCAGAVQPGDVLVSVAGRAVAADGTAELRPGQRVLFGHFVNTGSIGQALALEVVRAGQRLQLSIRLRCGQDIVPTSLGLRQPQYLIVAGLVFAPHVEPLFYDWQPPRPSRRRLLRPSDAGYLSLQAPMEFGLPVQAGEQVIALVGILPGAESTAPYAAELSRSPRRLLRLNGCAVLNMPHLAQLVLQLTRTAGSPQAQQHADAPTSSSNSSGGSSTSSSSSSGNSCGSSSTISTSNRSSSAGSRDEAEETTAGTRAAVPASPQGGAQGAPEAVGNSGGNDDRSDGPKLRAGEASGVPLGSADGKQAAAGAGAEVARATESGGPLLEGGKQGKERVWLAEMSAPGKGVGSSGSAPSPGLGSPVGMQQQLLEGQQGAEAGPGSSPDACESRFLRFEFSDGSLVVLDSAEVRAQTLQVLRGQSVSHAMSGGLRKGVPGALRWPEDECGREEASEEVQGRQRRQQRRRLAVRR